MLQILLKYLPPLIVLVAGHITLAMSGQLGASPFIHAGSFLVILLSLFYTKNLPRKMVILLSIIIPSLYLLSPASDDLNRYIWEGQLILEDINPYLLSPDSPELFSYRDSTYWPHINHKSLTAAYPPLVQWTFAGALAFQAHPYWSIKILMLGFFFLTSIGLWKAMNFKELDPHKILYWTANPFALIFLVGEAHFDIMMICGLVWAFYFQIQSKYVSSSLLLGLSICIKYFSIFTLPLFWNKNWKWANLFFLFPFFSLFTFDGIFTSLKTFGSDYRFNSFLYSLVESLSGPFGLIVVLAILAIVLAFHTATEPVLNQNIMYCTLALTAFLPTIHPWYLCLSIPWLIFYPFKSLWVLQTTLFIGLLPMYTQSVNMGIWSEIMEMRYFIWSPFLMMWIYEVIQSKRHHTPIKRFHKIQSLKVIIPIHNEKGNLLTLFNKLKESLDLVQETGIRANFQFIHSGIDDGCEALAITHQMPFYIAKQSGRGYQIREELLKSQEDLICILHADTDFNEDHFLKMVDEMNKEPIFYSGWCPMDFDHTQGLSLVRLLNSFRAQSLQITFGDQMQFFRQEALEHYLAKDEEFLPPMHLMEDVEMSMKLKELGPSLRLISPIRASSRRWQSTHRWKNALTIISICTLYLFARRFGWAPSETKLYQQLYYGK